MDQVVETSLLHGLMGRAEARSGARSTSSASWACPIPRHFGSRYPHQVSGGQLQRAMTAMALCPEPDLVIFDEPTTALDVTTQIDVLAAIKDAIRDTGVAALYITHDLAVVAQVSDEIMVLAQRQDGRIRRHRARSSSAPREDYTKALVSVRSIEHEEKPPADSRSCAVEAVTARYRGTNFDVLKNVSVDVGAGPDAGGRGRIRARASRRWRA